MKTISLTQGYVAIVDDEDYDLVVNLRWHASKSMTGAIYATSNPSRKRGSPKLPAIRMHRMIMGLPAYDIREVDHVIPEKTLDNRRCNLRIATSGQNKRNTRRRKDNSSGYKGVCYVEKRKKWMARISLNGKEKFLGYFDSAQSAADAYAYAAPIFHGEFARLA